MKKNYLFFYFYIFLIFRVKKKITFYKNTLDLKLFVVIIVFQPFYVYKYVFNYLNIFIMIEFQNVIILYIIKPNNDC